MIRLVGAGCARMGAFAEVVELAARTPEDVEIEGRCLGNAHHDDERERLVDRGLRAGRGQGMS